MKKWPWQVRWTITHYEFKQSYKIGVNAFKTAIEKDGKLYKNDKLVWSPK
jgi:hypothetical protein